jgi:hypothetical protein
MKHARRQAGGRGPSRVRRVVAPAPTPTLPRKRGREIEGSN